MDQPLKGKNYLSIAVKSLKGYSLELLQEHSKQVLTTFAIC